MIIAYVIQSRSRTTEEVPSLGDDPAVIIGPCKATIMKESCHVPSLFFPRFAFQLQVLVRGGEDFSEQAESIVCDQVVGGPEQFYGNYMIEEENWRWHYAIAAGH